MVERWAVDCEQVVGGTAGLGDCSHESRRPPPLTSAETDHESSREHNLQPPLEYGSLIQQFIPNDTTDRTLSSHQLQELNRAEKYLLKNVLLLLGNALSGTAAHAEIVLSSLFPVFPATEATKKVINFLQTLLVRLPTTSQKELMHWIYALAGLPLEHRSELVRNPEPGVQTGHIAFFDVQNADPIRSLYLEGIFNGGGHFIQEYAQYKEAAFLMLSWLSW
ncbi:hypothetical protein BLNAU_8152 [Blattamonas nauphoetae]|uniref:Uncharacterized protein n=1 Tax=Blattamonas nauphoetae TaxID=2049346 RepID=A0ABQ9XZH3_9EUKA|nr:hypothetical protein BLNAU_8152 [Blattamonas nauphoetae]